MTAVADCTHAVRHQHGTYAAYRQDGCRCFPCRFARYERNDTGDYVHVPAYGIRRRLQALATLGWGPSRIAAEVGVTEERVQQWRDGKYPQVRPETVARVDAAYRALRDRTPPADTRGDAISAAKTRNHAARQGWLPPSAWTDKTIDQADFVHTSCQPVANTGAFQMQRSLTVLARRGRPPIAERLAAQEIVDQVAVDRAMHGEQVALNTSEVSEVIRKLTRMGYSAAEIADRLRLSERTVQRWRDRGYAA